MSKNAELAAKVQAYEQAESARKFGETIAKAVGEKRFRDENAKGFFVNTIQNLYEVDENGVVKSKQTGQVVKAQDGTKLATLEELAAAHSVQLAYLFDQQGQAFKHNNPGPGGGFY